MFTTHTHDINDIATRIYDQIAPWDKESDTMDEIIRTLEDDPLAIIEDLLDTVELYTE